MSRAALLAWVLLAGAGCSEAKVIVDAHYHFPGTIDAVNLVARDGGDLSWGLDGCDFYAGDRGTWTFERDTIVVRPRSGGSMSWYGEAGILEDVASVVLSTTDDGATLDVHVNFANGSDSVDEVWLLGGMCPTCGAPLGPSGPTTECSDPYFEE